MTRLLAILTLALAAAAGGQPAATQPTTAPVYPQPLPVAVFFQPARNVPMLAGMGVTVFVGAEVENARGMTSDALTAARGAWIKAVGDAGAKCVLKYPPPQLPGHCVGVMLSVDEPNGRGVAAAALKAESDAFRQAYPGVPIFLSLAGDKVTSANFARPAELQAYLDYAAVCDVFTVDTYSANRNASRYPTTWTGDAVRKLAAATGKPVWAWVEMNDQRLPAPTLPDVNRAPTPAEIKATVDYAVASGAKGIGWFATCDSGKYGWGFAGDSYWPLVDRAGASIQPQLDMVAAISRALAPQPPTPATLPTTAPTVDPVAARLDAMQQTIDRLSVQLTDLARNTEKQINSVNAKLDAPLVRVPTTTQPTNP